MSNYVDIHTHILPNMDDGSQSIEETMKMIKIMASEGISDVICTPHFYPNRHNVSMPKVLSQVEILNQNIAAEGMQLKLYSGNEIYYRSSVPELLATHQANTLAGSFYVLVEFNPSEEFSYIRNAVYELQTDGYIPIIAHAERYQHMMSNFEKCYEIVKMGAYIQVNAGSITGEFGHEAKSAAKKLLKERLVHFIATDAHDEKKRAPHLKKAARIISRKYGKGYAEELLCINPRKVLNNEEIN